jgi:hypothetical protein
MVVATKFMEEPGASYGWGRPGGCPQHGLKDRHDTKPKKAQNRWHSTFLWSHRMIHISSGARNRTKQSVSSLAFQCIQDHLISMSYEGDIDEIMQGCRLNLRRTRWLSWWWLVTWRRPWHDRVQHGDVLISGDDNRSNEITSVNMLLFTLTNIQF